MKKLPGVKTFIQPGIKPIDALCAWLEDAYDAELITMNEFSDHLAKMMRFNAFHTEANKALQVAEDDMQFIPYRLRETAKNAVLFETSSSYLNYGGYVYVIIEVKTGYIFCNHNKLFLELVIEQGVSQFDYDNETLMLRWYLDCMERLALGKY